MARDFSLPIASTGDPVKKEKCQKYLLELFVSSPIILYMKDALKQAGCPLFVNDIQCVPCSTDLPISGFYRPGKGVFLCEETIYSPTHLQETLTHELLHAFDYCTKDIDLSNNCIQNICTEVRSSSSRLIWRLEHQIWAENVDLQMNSVAGFLE